MEANVQVQPSKENQNYPPSPETKKTKILNKIQKQYELILLGNGKQKIGVKAFHKSEEVQDLLKRGLKTHGIPMRGEKAITRQGIANRIRKVNKEFEINKRGAPPKASERKPKTNEPIPKKEKVDLDKLAEDFLEDDF